MKEQEAAIKEINNKLSNLANLCRSKEQLGKEKDISTVKESLDIFNYSVDQFSGCLPENVLAQIEGRQEMAKKMVAELIGKLEKRQNGWSI